MSAVYGDAVRLCVFPKPEKDLPAGRPIEDGLSFDRLAIHKDAQGMLRAQKRTIRILFDPPSGHFKVTGTRGDTFEGTVQTGTFASPLFLVRLQKDDVIYGMGAASGRLTKNDQSFRMLNLDTLFYTIPGSSYSSFPFFWIRRGKQFTAILLNSTLPARVSVGNSENDPAGSCVRFDLDTDGGAFPVDFFVFQGTPKEILDQFTQITGRPHLAPLWALGFQQSRWSYRSAERVIALAEKFRSEEVPCDAIHLDIHYMDRYRVFTWDPKHFANPSGMHARLKELGMRTVSIVDPGVARAPGYSVYEDGVNKNFFCRTKEGSIFHGKVWPGVTAFPDFTRDDVREWWGEQHGPLFAAGTSGIWNDMNDPVLWMGKKYDPLGQNVVHRTGSHREVRNLYANLEAEGTWIGFQKHKPDHRPFILTRSACTGIQKHAWLWTGDNRSNWKHLRENLNMVLNLGLTGVPLCGSDVGGFGSGTEIPFLMELAAVKIKKDKELFARWMELGSLMPFFRAHTTLYSYDQEPWSFGPEVLAVAKKHIRRRYRLLPYIYSLVHNAHRTGEPMVRTVFYEYPEIPERQSQGLFFLGPSLLAAPVLEPGQSMRKVFLPPGDWYEYESGRKIHGDREEEIPVVPGYFPLFVKAGTALPVAQPGRNADETLAGEIGFEIYPGPDLTGSLILDDGWSHAADRGETMEARLSGREDRTGNLILELVFDKKRFTPKAKNLILRMPPNYRMMELRGKKSEGALISLAREDRPFSMFQFELPWQNLRAEFPYRSSWNS